MSLQMIRLFALLASCAAMIGSAFAQQSRPVLVELFASQNCPACPKAHRTLQALTETRDDIFVLTWSVDYWDYLGKPDPMALPEAKVRQAAYVEQMGLRAPYTPQSFYDGAKQCPGTKRNQVEANIRLRQTGDLETVPEVSFSDRQLSLIGPCEEPLELTLVEYLAGEANTTGMVNPVTSARSLGLWTGQSDAFDVSCRRDCAVLLHKPDFGEVLLVQPLQ